MTELLDTLVEYLWIIDFFIFCLLGILVYQQRQLNSSFMTQSAIVIISGTITKYEGLILSFVNPASGQNAFALWCFGFVLFDCAVVFVLYRFYGTVKKRIDSAKQTFAYALISGGFVIGNIYGQYSTLYLGDKGMSYKLWILIAFHLGACLFYSLAIFAVMKAHKLANKHHTLIARTYILAFSVAALIQVSMLNELYFFETEYLDGVYRWGLASINVGTTGVAMVVACLGVWQYLRKSERQGWLWTL
jgi:hypothetical protein